MSNKAFEYAHGDFWGLTRANTHGGRPYFFTIIDDYSRGCGFISWKVRL